MKRLLSIVLLIVIGTGGVLADTQASAYQQPRKPPEKIKDKPKPDDRNKDRGSKDDKKRDDRKKPEFN